MHFSNLTFCSLFLLFLFGSLQAFLLQNIIAERRSATFERIFHGAFTNQKVKLAKQKVKLLRANNATTRRRKRSAKSPPQ